MSQVPMLRLCQAGLIAAGYQTIAVVSIALAILLLAGHGIDARPGLAEAPNGSGSLWNPAGPLASWANLLTAFGVIFTNNRHVEDTARYIRHATRLLNPTVPDQTTIALLVQFWLVSVAFVICALKPSPDFFIQVGDRLGCAWVASIVWPGMMSIGLAGFGANARAAHTALEPS
jgi:hypothetical protein